jgi:hypothetical protein
VQSTCRVSALRSRRFRPFESIIPIYDALAAAAPCVSCTSDVLHRVAQRHAPGRGPSAHRAPLRRISLCGASFGGGSNAKPGYEALINLVRD